MSVLDPILIKHALAMKDHPDALGEVLRDWAFKEKYGCYSCFDVIDGFTKVDTGPREFELMWGRKYDPEFHDEMWGYADQNAIKDICWFKHDNGIEMGWYWDGGGLLIFYVPELVDEYYDGTLSNSDCKKDYGWEFAMKGNIDV